MGLVSWVWPLPRAASRVPRGLVCPAPAASSCSPAPQAEALGFSGRGSGP